jgi:hypothetical protein
MIIKNLQFANHSTEDEKVTLIHLNESPYWRKTLSFGFYRRTEQNSRNDNPYNLNVNWVPQQWSGNWYFGVNYRVLCQGSDTIFTHNVNYANIFAAGFLKKGWLLIPHYYCSQNDQGVDFFKILTTGTRLQNEEYGQDFKIWLIKRLAVIGESSIDPMCHKIVGQSIDIAAIIGEAKLLL